MTKTSPKPLTKLDFKIGIILFTFLLSGLIGCALHKKATHGNGTIETEQLIQTRKR